MKKTAPMHNDPAIAHIVDMAQKSLLPQLVTISGSTCSGKTTFSQKLKQKLHGIGKTVSIICLDEYFLDGDDPDFPKQHLDRLFDVPGAYHKDEFVRDISALCKGMPIEMPVYDLTLNKRSPRKRTAAPCDYIIAEGLFAGTFLAATPIEKFHIYMETPVETCLERRIARDTKAYRVSKARVIENWRRKILPFWNTHQHHEKTIENE